MTDPMIGTQQAIIVTRQRRLLHFAAMSENTNAERVDITPVGMLKREELIPEKPRPAIISPPKVVNPNFFQEILATSVERAEEVPIPPLGILIAMLKKNKIQVFGSRIASLAWSSLNFLLTIPVLLEASRCTA